MKLRLLTGLALAWSAFGVAHADLDPELAQTAIKNDSGLYLGGGVRFGQSYGTGGSTPGFGTLVFVDPGYATRRDSWGRFEIGAELSSGMMSYRTKGSDKSTVDVTMPYTIMAKLGYGYSIGNSVFSVLKVAVGPSVAEFESKSDGVKAKSDGTVTGLASQLAWDVVFPTSSVLDLIGGASVTHYAYDIGELKVGNKTVAGDYGPIAINLIALQIGARFTF